MGGSSLPTLSSSSSSKPQPVPIPPSKLAKALKYYDRYLHEVALDRDSVSARATPKSNAKAKLLRHLGSCSVCRSRRVPCSLEHHDVDFLEKEWKAQLPNKEAKSPKARGPIMTFLKPFLGRRESGLQDIASPDVGVSRLASPQGIRIAHDDENIVRLSDSQAVRFTKDVATAPILPSTSLSTNLVRRPPPTSVDQEQYQSLDYSQEEIRLLYLLPGVHDSEIRCITRQFPLNSCPGYFAVSYTWGDPNTNSSIWLNNAAFSVRENLWGLLHQFRSEETELILWIDAVCINQDSLLERNQQVRLMSSIYQNATRVLLWLGPAADYSDIVLAFLQRYGEDEEGVCSCQYPHGNESDVRYRPQRHSCQPLDEPLPSLTNFGSRTQTAIRDILNRAYWQRAWIIQELLLAEDIDICCGDRVIQWDTFRKFILDQTPRLVQDSKAERGEVYSGNQTMVQHLAVDSLVLPTRVSALSYVVMKSAAFSLCSQRKPQQKDPKKSNPEISAAIPKVSPTIQDASETEPATRRAFKLAELIQRNMHVQCSDLRDKVYAFLGLATDCTNGQGILPDYSKSLAQLYVDVVRFCGVAETGLQFMFNVRDMLNLTTKETSEFGWDPTTLSPQETVSITAAHMGTISAAFPNWFANNSFSVTDHQKFFCLALGDLPTFTMDEILNSESLQAFLPRLPNRNKQAIDKESRPALILTGRRATHRVGFACSAAREGDIVCQFLNSENAVIVRQSGSSFTIVGEAVMMKQRLSEETPSNILTGENFMFSAISQKGLEKTTQLTWRLHPLELVDWELAQAGLGSATIKPPQSSGYSRSSGIIRFT